MMFNDHVLLKRELTATEPKYGESVIHEILMLLKCPLAVNITASKINFQSDFFFSAIINKKKY